MPRFARLFAPIALALSLMGAPAAFADTGALSYGRIEGRNINHFVRDGDVAAHLLLRSGADPRIIVAFPAGNSGAGLWLDIPQGQGSGDWTLTTPPIAVTESDGQGRPLHGITFQASLAAGTVGIRQAVLSSVRVLRDYDALRTVPDSISPDLVRDGARFVWARDRLDGKAGYRLTVEVVHGQATETGLKADPDGTIGLRVTALTGETPLTPLPVDALLNAQAAQDTATRDTLAFLSYREKFLAGSWRFDTYFGRDTMMSLMLLMPALQGDAVEAGLRSVFARLSLIGEVAHEEDVGEFAILDHLKREATASDDPVYDYKMVDGDFMLPAVTRAWLLDDAQGRARAAAFLASGDGRTDQVGPVGRDLVQNLRYVILHAAAFAREPRYSNMIRLKHGLPVGQWRDSNDGLGGGLYAYDVNAVLVPAALEACAALLKSGLLDPYMDPGDRPLLSRAAGMAAVWRAKAPPLFTVTIPERRAKAQVAAYAHDLGVPDTAAALGRGAVRFHALSLDRDGAPVRVMHSDEGFGLLFRRPDARTLDQVAQGLMRPFPAGLMTGAGMVVANPVFAPPEVQARFTRNAYHGSVVWSWQQAMMATGLERQARRPDLPRATKERLRQAQAALWRAIEATRGLQNSELWSWAYQDGRYQPVAFGASGADADEANAAQLWSTVYLAVRPPADR
ncbi:hypothetical protein FBZ89_12139 [Nitrospirillum amazonense]|uniref:Lipoprotein n=1 Tax=Nitrospirillum amazonense TaxID=28077 RepID=A0A560EUL5_9PROT|nr:hypothetical protein [Nitrospirillum amazonense]TWB13072.1 hypothetical protein FBZ89_12139 [Nitrospirillum amazonense]